MLPLLARPMGDGPAAVLTRPFVVATKVGRCECVGWGPGDASAVAVEKALEPASLVVGPASVSRATRNHRLGRVSGVSVRCVSAS